jgi:hypothetical protein
MFDRYCWLPILSYKYVSPTTSLGVGVCAVQLISTLLLVLGRDAAAVVVHQKIESGCSVLVHCSDGWDRTPQVFTQLIHFLSSASIPGCLITSVVDHGIGVLDP